MRSFLISTVILVFIFFTSCNPKPKKQDHSDKKPKVSFVENDLDKSIDVLIGGGLFTTFRWPDNMTKPVLHPIFTAAGTEITRGFPIQPREGERLDHAHQIGMWLTYGNVDGSNFWGNGYAGLGTRSEDGGVIKHLNVDKLTEGSGEGVMVTTESWINNLGKEVLSEHTEYHFMAEDNVRIIDRVTKLTATGNDVVMPDTKEGMFGIRVARQLELPDEGEIIYGPDGQMNKVKEMLNNGVSGNYRSSEGDTGLEVWGTRARWMDLYGNIGNEDISLVICDHPKNQSYPTWWHARGYGLFAANPLGAKDFTKGEEIMDFTIPAGQSTTFRYRVVISSGFHLTDAEMNAYADDFAKKY